MLKWTRESTQIVNAFEQTSCFQKRSSFLTLSSASQPTRKSYAPSISLPRRFRTRTPRHTPLIPPPLSQPLLRPQLQLPIQLRTRFLPMYKIAEPPSDTAFAAIQPATRFSEIGHGAELAVDGPGGVPARVERIAGLLRGVFVFEAGVDVADEIYGRIKFVSIYTCQIYISTEKGGGRKQPRKRRGAHTIIIIITNNHLLRLPILAHLAPEILVKSIEMVLQLRRIHLVFGIVRRVLVEVGEEDGLGVGGFDVFAGAAVAVAAGADFVVETAVYFVLFCAEDGG